MTARSMAPFDPDVVAPWTFGDGPRGALLLHGFAGTPPELRRLGEYLSLHGWKVSGPAIAGHGTTPEDLARTNWHDWAASAQQSLDELASKCDQVVVIGQSMGGAMALHLAATNLQIAAVATLAAPIWIDSWSRPFIPFLHHVYRWYKPRSRSDLYRPEAIEELHSYGRRPTNAIHQLFRMIAEVGDELPSVRAPVLLLQGGRDSVVDPSNARDIERRLVCSVEVERHLYPRSGHTLSVDIDRDDVNQRVLRWLDQHCPTPAS